MNETQYFRLPLRARLEARAKRATYTRSPIFAAPYKPQDPTPPSRLRWIEAGHGLRVVPCADIIKLDHNGWFVDQFQDETTAAHIIRLPKRRGFLLAASDPWNDDCYTVENCPPMPAAPVARMHGPPDPEQGARDAARLAEQFTERLAEDYRDDAEHQTALADYEENLHPLEKAKAKAEASATKHQDDADNREAERAQLEHNLTMDLHPQERQQVQAEHDWIQSQRNEAQRRADAAQESAADIQNQMDELETPTAPNFNYFGKAKR